MKKLILLSCIVLFLIFLIYPIISWHVFDKPTFMSKMIPVGVSCMPPMPSKQWLYKDAKNRFISVKPLPMWQRLFGGFEPVCAYY